MSQRALEKFSASARVLCALEHFCGSVRALENFRAVLVAPCRSSTFSSPCRGGKYLR